MMVETILESPQDLGMSNGASAGAGAGGLPQWKRELLQRRAARTPPPRPPPHPPHPPPAVHDADDEELHYGPGIVKRLKSRYLSLALRETPRRRSSVLRRATSLEHLLNEPPPPPPQRPPHAARPARPVSALLPADRDAAPRRDFVKRARSVDALSRLDSCDEPPQTPPPPPPPRPPPPPPPPPAQHGPCARSGRPPRRPAPLLRDAERPPADVVRSTLRKFESVPLRRTAPAGRVSAVLRGLSARTSPPSPPLRCSTPEPRARSPSPASADLSAIDDPDGAGATARQVSRAALEGIARAGCTVRYAFEAPRRGSHLPPVAASNPVLLGRARSSPSPRRVGVIRPMPSPARARADPSPEKIIVAPKIEAESEAASPPPCDCRLERREAPPSAAVEPTPRSPLPAPEPAGGALPNGLAEPAGREKRRDEPAPAPALVNGSRSRISEAKIERAWSSGREVTSGRGGWAGPRAARAPPEQQPTSIVFDFSSRKEVPDYIENDGMVLRTSRRDKLKRGEPGAAALRPEAAGEDGGEEAPDGAPPSPCGVRFVNDNVLINGRSSMPPRPDRDRIARLKLQFDDSLTRTFEYPSETSLCEDSPSPALADNTRIASATLNSYRPSKTAAAAFQLGVTRAPPAAAQQPALAPAEPEGDARPCGDDARSWSDARTQRTDLLF